jgi:hypothetical protein
MSTTTAVRVDKKKKEPRSAKYSDLVEQVSTILKIEPNPGWKIKDKTEDGRYVLVHYSEDPKIRDRPDYDYDNLRGTIVDLKTGEIVRQTIPHMPECEHSELEIDDSGTLRLYPIESSTGPVTMKVTDATLYKGHDGVWLDIWKGNGVVRESSLKKTNIKGSNSKVNNSITYEEAFKQFGIPTDALFSADHKDSPFVHSFLLVHPSFSQATKEMIGRGYAVYLGYTTMKFNDPSVYDLEPTPVNIESVAKCTHKYSQLNLHQEDGDRLIYIPAAITAKAANYHLRYGYYEVWNDEQVHPNLRTGELVIVKNNITGKSYRVLSPAHHWRILVRGRDTTRRGFFLLAYDAIRDRSKKNKIDYFECGFYPQLYNQDLDLIRDTVKEGKPVLWLRQNGEKLDLNTYQGRLLNIWLCMLLAVPVHMQRDVLDAIEEFEVLLIQGAEDSIKIVSAKTGVYQEDECNVARTISYIPYDRRGCGHNFAIKYISNKLRGMEPSVSYQNIVRMHKEIERVIRASKKATK